MVQPGTLLEGKYEILDKIREGGMGSIYRVRHRLLEEIRVVKVMKPSVIADEDLRRRFVEEARTATRLKHPNICTIHDFAIDDSGMAYLVMEFIDGVSVSDLLKLHGRPGLPLALEIAHQSLLALGFLHRKGIVHRDVAPDNIMLTRDEQGGALVKLIDLGIAKVAEAPVEATATGVFLGKLKYASPEQYGSLPRGHRLDGRSDLYGLGIVLYELLTGVLPFEGDTVVELLKAHVFAPPRPFSQSDPDGRVPTELRGAVLKSLQKKREDRFANAEEFDREILAIRSRYKRPEDQEEIRAELVRIRPSGGIRVEPATPSAQSEIDRQFAALRTPTPSRKIEDARTEVAPEPALVHPSASVDVRRSLVATTPIPRPPSRTIPIWVVATGAAAIAVAAFLWMTSLRREPPPAAAPEPTTAVAAILPTAAAAPEPSATPAPEPTEEPAAPTPPPPTAVRREPTRVAAAAARRAASAPLRSRSRRRPPLVAAPVAAARGAGASDSVRRAGSAHIACADGPPRPDRGGPDPRDGPALRDRAEHAGPRPLRPRISRRRPRPHRAGLLELPLAVGDVRGPARSRWARREARRRSSASKPAWPCPRPATISASPPTACFSSRSAATPGSSSPFAERPAPRPQKL